MTGTSNNKDSVLTSLSELRRIEAERVAEDEAARQAREAARLAAEQEAARQEREAARRKEEAEAARRRQEAERQEADDRQRQLRQQEAERMRRVEAELALERARILSEPLEVSGKRPALVWALMAVLGVGLVAGNAVKCALECAEKL